MAALTEAKDVVWCDGSQQEYDRLCQQLVDAGTFKRLNPAKRANSFLAITDPSDVARVEDRTYICSAKKEDAGPTNNWMAPAEMSELLETGSTALFDGCMRGRTMYVIPFSMGPLGSTDRADRHRAVSDSGLRGGHEHADHDADGQARLLGRARCRRRFRALPCTFGRRPAGTRPEADVAWPCNAKTKYIVQFPETREIWSVRLRLWRQRAARQEVLRAAHRVLHGPQGVAGRRPRLAGRAHADPRRHVNPQGVQVPRRGRVPQSACGKTNFAMMIPPEGVRRLEGLDDRRRHRVDQAGCRTGKLSRDQPGGRLLRRRAGHERRRAIRTAWRRCTENVHVHERRDDR